MNPIPSHPILARNLCTYRLLTPSIDHSICTPHPTTPYHTQPFNQVQSNHSTWVHPQMPSYTLHKPNSSQTMHPPIQSPYSVDSIIVYGCTHITASALPCPHKSNRTFADLLSSRSWLETAVSSNMIRLGIARMTLNL
mmetsp:Transcript_30085/g.48608  ORF Transcript_30085/g.48608 Transcript_30085/m.48608 type:complete len:138 (-) Transcript_30085:397-810(-)